MADLKLTIDDSDIIQALDNIDKKLVDAGAQATDTGKKIGAAFNETEEDAKRAAAALGEYKAAQDKLAAGAQARVAGNKALQDSLAKYRKEQEEMLRVQEEAARKNVEGVKGIQAHTDALKSQAAATANTAKSTGGLVGGIGGFLRVLGPVGLAIGAVVAFLGKFQDGLDFVQKIMASVSATVTVLVDRIVLLGRSFGAFLNGDFRGAAALFAESTTGIGAAIVDAATKAYNLEGRMQALRDAQLDAAVSTAKLAAASEKAQAIASQENATYDEKIQALRRAIALEEQIAATRVGFAAQAAALAKEEFALSSKGVADKEKLIGAEIALVGARNEADTKRIELLGQLNQVEKERTEFIIKNLNEVSKLIDKFDVELQQDPIEKSIEQVRQRIEAQVKAAEDGLKKLAEVEKLRPLNADEIDKRQKLQDDIVKIIENGEKDIAAALLDGLRKESEIEEKKKEALKAAAEQRSDDARKALKDVLDLTNAQIDITEAEFSNLIATLQAGGAKESDVKQAQNEFDRRIKAERIKAEISYQKKLLELAGSGVSADLIQAEIDKLQIVLEGLEIPEPKAKDKGPKTIFDLLGIKFDDPEQEKAIQDSIGRIIDSLGQLAQARVNEAEAATKAAEDKVKAAEDALEKEQDLAKEGFANNTDIRKRELDEAKKARDIALKEEERAKKQQIALDSAVQLSSLVTAAANIFKGFSTIPILGQVLAVVSVAAMFASFAAAKANALKAASAPKLRKGMRFDGPTHDAGNEDMAFDGRRVYAVEKDEWLIGTEHSREHNAFLSRLNKGEFKGINLLDAVGRAKGDHDKNPLSESAPRIRRMEERLAEAKEQSHYKALVTAYERGADRITAAINEKPVVAPWKQGFKLMRQTAGGTDTKTVLPE